MIKTKCIFLPKNFQDGLRISVMSRHTLNDGKTPDLRINLSTYGLWMRSLAPPEYLVGDYYKRGLSWTEFEQKYLDHLRHSNVQTDVQSLAAQGMVSIITLLCVEKLPEYCHRRLLAEECKRYEPSLDLRIN